MLQEQQCFSPIPSSILLIFALPLFVQLPLTEAVVDPFIAPELQQGHQFDFQEFIQKDGPAFIEFQEETAEDKAKFGEQRCYCGKHLLRDMRKWYRKENWHFRVWAEPLGKGTYSRVFHAHPMAQLKGINGKPIELHQCVAIKAVLVNNKMHQYARHDLYNEYKILKHFSERYARRVIRLFAAQAVRWNDAVASKQLYYVLELGEKSLQKVIDQETNVQKTNKVIKEQITEVLETVAEIHRSAMHLDVKLGNMVYVNEPDGNGGHSRMLKMIDFSSSELIPENDAWNGKRANVSKAKKLSWGTIPNVSPEQYCPRDKIYEHEEFKLTTKADMWSVGILLLEMMFTGTKQTVDGLLVDVYNYYKPSTRRSTRLPDRTIEMIRKARNQFPELFNIVVATLNPDPLKRPTAYGLLEYLSGKCQLQRVASTHDLFIYLSVNNNGGKAKNDAGSHPLLIGEILEQKNGQNNNKSNSTIRRRFLERFKEFKANFVGKKEKELASPLPACDTEYTG